MKYKAYAKISYELVCEYEVEDGQDPWEIAQNLDGGDFKEIDGSSDWTLFEVLPSETVQRFFNPAKEYQNV